MMTPAVAKRSASQTTPTVTTTQNLIVIAKTRVRRHGMMQSMGTNADGKRLKNQVAVIIKENLTLMWKPHNMQMMNSQMPQTYQPEDN